MRFFKPAISLSFSISYSLRSSSLNIIRNMSTFDEVNAAANAVSTDPAINPYAPTFFDKIVSKEIPAQVRLSFFLYYYYQYYYQHYYYLDYL